MHQEVKITCPVCNLEVERLVYRYHLEDERRIISIIRENHPSWSENDGICSRCIDHFLSAVIKKKLPVEAGPYYQLVSVQNFEVLPTAIRVDTDARLTGKGVTICFIDSGFFIHPDIESRVKVMIDINEPHLPANESTRDYMWHGTMTSVVCAGNGRMSDGLYKGIVPEADLVLIKVQDNNGRITTKSIRKALEWIRENHDVFKIRIVNISVGEDEPDSYLDSETDRLAEELVTKGIVVIAAAGNDIHRKITPPANSPAVIAVGGWNDHNNTDPSAGELYHSSFEAADTELAKPDVMAPAMWIAAPILPQTSVHNKAVELFRLLEKNKQGTEKQKDEFESDTWKQIRERRFISGDYMHVDGTSFAAPIVSGIVAQLIQVHPALSPAMIREILLSTAKRIEGFDAKRQGYGLINPRLAIRRALNLQQSTGYNTSPRIDRQNKMISFSVRHERATKVSLVGSFNFWSIDQLLMEPVEDGEWNLQIPILPNGKYEYKFLIDDHTWMEDVRNPFRVPDGINGFNSILKI